MEEMSTSSNLLGGHFAPRWVYFQFYLDCRRQQEAPGSQWIRFRDPAFLAWNLAGITFAAPSLALLLLIDHYLPFLHSLGHVWISLQLPGDPGFAWGYAWIVCGLIFSMGLFILFFGGRYKRIMQEFVAYNRSQYSVIPNLILSIPWFAMGGIAIYGLVYRASDWVLLISNLVILAIFLATEIGFRLWWRWWHRHYVEAQPDPQPAQHG